MYGNPLRFNYQCLSISTTILSMPKLNANQIKKDMEKAQKSYEDACSTASYYLHVNGMNMKSVKECLHDTLERCCDKVEYVRKTGADNKLWDEFYGKDEDLR